jgi:hypothetical protein
LMGISIEINCPGIYSTGISDVNSNVTISLG